MLENGPDGCRVLGNARIASLSDVKDPRELISLISRVRNPEARWGQLVYVAFRVSPFFLTGVQRQDGYSFGIKPRGSRSAIRCPWIRYC